MRESASRPNITYKYDICPAPIANAGIQVYVWGNHRYLEHLLVRGRREASLFSKKVRHCRGLTLSELTFDEFCTRGQGGTAATPPTSNSTKQELWAVKYRPGDPTAPRGDADEPPGY